MKTKLTEQQLIAAARTMIRQGGSFAGAIGEAYVAADETNRARLIAAFADIFERFSA